MIIWINGAFGAGKTQSAFELDRRLENSFLYDPEKMGFFINDNMPGSIKDREDFQDYPLWRQLNLSHLKYIEEKYDGVIIVPMTIVKPEYFNEIIGELRRQGVRVDHYALMASKDTIHKRLKGRGTGKNSWGAKRTESCLKGLSHEVFKNHVDTENLSIYEVVEKIAGMSGLDLKEDKTGRIGKKINRIKTQMKQLRWFQN